MGLKIASAKKTNSRKLATTSVSANQLTPMVATRVFGDERKLGQYKLENGELVRFRHFKDLRLYSNLVLRNKNKHIILVRDDQG